MRRYTLSKSGYCTMIIHNYTVYSIYLICYISVSPVTYRPYVYCVTDFHTRLQIMYMSIYFIYNINKLRNTHTHILYTQDICLLLYIRPFQIQAIWWSVPLLYSTNTYLLYRTMANMYIVYPCIYTHRSLNVICTYTWSTLPYTVHFQTRMCSFTTQ